MHLSLSRSFTNGNHLFCDIYGVYRLILKLTEICIYNPTITRIRVSISYLTSLVNPYTGNLITLTCYYYIGDWKRDSAFSSRTTT